MERLWLFSVTVVLLGACLRSSDTNAQPTATVTVDPFIGNTTKSIFKKLNCTTEEENVRDCRNNGRCVKQLNTVDGTSTTRCNCAGTDYTGQRCGTRIRPDPTISKSGTPGVIAAIVVGIIIVTVIILLLVKLYCLPNRRDQDNASVRRRQLENQHNGTNGASHDEEEAHESIRTNDENKVLIEMKENNNTD